MMQDIAEVVTDAIDIGQADSKTKALRAFLALRNSCGGIIKLKLKHTKRDAERFEDWKEKFSQKVIEKLKDTGEEDPHTDIHWKHFGDVALIFVTKSSTILTVDESNLFKRREKQNEPIESFEKIKNMLTKGERNTSSPCKCHKCEQKIVHYLSEDSFAKEGLCESKYVEFKHFPDKKFKDLAGLREKAKKNFVAFSNTDGGTLYIGVKDNGEIKGQLVEDEKQVEITIDQAINETKYIPYEEMISEHPPKSHNIRFIPVEGKPNMKVIAIDICKFVNGTVFCGEPKFPTIDQDGKVLDLALEKWLLQFKDPENDPKFETKQSGLVVYKEIKGTMRSILQSMDNENEVKIHPKHAKEWINNVALERLLDLVLPSMTNGGHVFVQRCWSTLMGKPDLQQPSNTICDVLLCSPDLPLVMVTLADSHSQEVCEYNTKLARTLKRVLAQEAGCVQAFLVKPQVLTTADLSFESIAINIFSLPAYYPDVYHPNRDSHLKVLEALALVIVRVRSNISSDAGLEHYFLLTKDQYTILDKFYKTASKVVITGLPGTGKTILALERIRQLRSKISWYNVLYVCSNKCLEATVRNRSLNGKPFCAVIKFWRLAKNPEMVRNFAHIILDEVHNYEAKPSSGYCEGWWEVAMGNNNCTYWLFLDESQRIPTGVASSVAVGSVSYNLETVVRGTKEIFNFYKHFIEEDTSNVDFGHDMDGTTPTIHIPENLLDDRDKLQKVLLPMLYKLIANEGHSPKDITVLFADNNTAESFRTKFPCLATFCSIRTGEQPNSNGVVFESIRRYSGEENSIVIGFCPNYDSNEFSQNNKALMVSLCSRALLQLILVFDSESTALCFLNEGFNNKEIDNLNITMI